MHVSCTTNMWDNLHGQFSACGSPVRKAHVGPRHTPPRAAGPLHCSCAALWPARGVIRPMQQCRTRVWLNWSRERRRAQRATQPSRRMVLGEREGLPVLPPCLSPAAPLPPSHHPYPWTPSRSAASAPPSRCGCGCGRCRWPYRPPTFRTRRSGSTGWLRRGRWARSISASKSTSTSTTQVRRRGRGACRARVLCVRACVRGEVGMVFPGWLGETGRGGAREEGGRRGELGRGVACTPRTAVAKGCCCVGPPNMSASHPGRRRRACCVLA